jgi:hypothetical protein
MVKMYVMIAAIPLRKPSAKSRIVLVIDHYDNIIVSHVSTFGVYRCAT